MRKEHCTSAKLANSGAIIKTTTCGTAMIRTVYVKVNCEMTVEGAQYLAQRILEEANWIAAAPKDCKDCEHKKGCPEVEA